MTFTHLKYLSFTHSAIYVTLIVLAVLNHPAKLYFGWAHGIGWIVISLLCNTQGTGISDLGTSIGALLIKN